MSEEILDDDQQCYEPLDEEYVHTFTKFHELQDLLRTDHDLFS